MRLACAEVRVAGPSGQDESVNFPVDSGIGYSLLPNLVWRSPGLEPTREERFSLADGTLVMRNLSPCHIVPPKVQNYSPVILGEESGNQAQFDAATFENTGPVLNPFSRTLPPTRLLWHN